MRFLYVRRVCLLFGVASLFLSTQPSYVAAGGKPSTGRGQYVEADELWLKSVPSAASGVGSAGRLPAPLPNVPQLPAELSVFDTPNVVMNPSIQALPDRLYRLGYRSATVTLHDESFRNMQAIQHLVLRQIKFDPSKRQFIPIFASRGMKTYALPLNYLMGTNWPSSVGRIGGKNGVSKAAIVSVFDTGEAHGMGRGMRLYGIARIQHADDLHRPLGEVQRWMQDVPEVLRF